jgi:asparagine synthase (glutamine-hydrolysing)
LQTDHTELYVRPEDALAVIPRLPAIYDEPFADSSQVPTFLISELTRQHVTVALSGDGGDELFAGYSRYFWADMVWRRFGGMPKALRHVLAGTIDAFPERFWEAGARLIPARRRPPRIGERAGKLAQFLRQPDAISIYRQQHSHWANPDSMLREGRESGDPLKLSQAPGNFVDFIQRMQYLDATTYLPDDILTKVDRASMAVSLEARVPILDHRVVEHVWRLPPSLRFRDGRGKWLLRQILERHLPRELIDRPKKGFSIPTGAWLRGPLRDWSEDLLSEERLRRDGFFDPQPIRRAWRELQAGKPWHEPIWGVLMFQAWYDGQARAL